MEKVMNHRHSFRCFLRNFIVFVVPERSLLRNRELDSVWMFDLNKHRFLRFYLLIFSIVLVSIAKIYQTLQTVFKFPNVQISSSHLVVWKCVQHGLSCLICYFNTREGLSTNFQTPWTFCYKSDPNIVSDPSVKRLYVIFIVDQLEMKMYWKWCLSLYPN